MAPKDHSRQYDGGDQKAVRGRLKAYRARLNDLLSRASNSDGPTPSINRELADFVDDLNADLLNLYRRLECGVVTATEREILIPTLESIRDILRRRDVLRRPIAKTLERALSKATVRS